MHKNPTRRLFLKSMGVSGATCLVDSRYLWAFRKRKKLPVAAVVSVYRPNSHADVIVGKILEGWRQNGGVGPDLQLVSLYTDQTPKNDQSRQLAEKHGFRLAKTIDEAVTLGRDELPIAGVLSIGEHGRYPLTPDTKQTMYPRRRFFDEIVAAMQRCEQVVPLFNDKHLAYNWADAKHMYDTAKSNRIPFMAGSSLPTAWRYPATSLPLGIPLEEAVVIGFGGLERYGFHALEALQCIVERRQGGETGVEAVTGLNYEQAIAAEQQGKWSRGLLAAAANACDTSIQNMEQRLNKSRTAFYHIEYKDGFRATCAMLNGIATKIAVACKIKGQAKPLANWIRLEGKPYGHFEHLLRGIEHMIQRGTPAYCVERTLLTTGILNRALDSVYQNGVRLKSPELAICYPPPTWKFANEEVENFPS